MKSSNTQSSLLGAFGCIGRAWKFDNIEDETAMSRETNRQHFIVFIECRSSMLYKRCVLDLSLNGMIVKHESSFNLVGFNGCIGSTDATRVGMLNCAAWTHMLHEGFKLDVPSHTCNTTVAHGRHILGSTCGHSAT